MKSPIEAQRMTHIVTRIDTTDHRGNPVRVTLPYVPGIGAKPEAFDPRSRLQVTSAKSIEALVEELGRRFQMAVVTTSKRRDFELIHRDRTLLDSMAFVLCREDYVQAKPHAEPYETGLRRFGIGIVLG